MGDPHLPGAEGLIPSYTTPVDSNRSAEAEYFEGHDFKGYDRWQLGTVLALVETLEKPQRQVVEARYWRDASWKDVAAAVGMSVATAQRRHAEAVNWLRFWLCSKDS